MQYKISMIIGKKKVTIHINPLIILITFAILFVQCKNEESNKKYLVKQILNIKFKGKKTGYEWNFNRIVNKGLTIISSKELDINTLYTIQFSNKKLFSLDYSNSKIYEFDSLLNVVKMKGEKGRFDENRNEGIMNFEFFNDTLILFDFGSKKIKYYNWATNKYLSSKLISPNKSIYRTSFINSSKVLINLPDDSSQSFQFCSYDLRNNSFFKVGDFDSLGLQTKSKYSGYEYDGHFYTDSESNLIVYQCSFAGLFFCFDKVTSKMLYYSQTIDKTPSPKAEFIYISTNHKSLEITPNFMFFPSSCVNNTKLYLLNTINNTNDYFIDIYDLKKGGNYLSSFFIPFNKSTGIPISISVLNDEIAVLYKNSILKKYEIKNL